MTCKNCASLEIQLQDTQADYGTIDYDLELAKEELATKEEIIRTLLRERDSLIKQRDHYFNTAKCLHDEWNEERKKLY